MDTKGDEIKSDSMCVTGARLCSREFGRQLASTPYKTVAIKQ
jgi:hypothetical protein